MSPGKVDHINASTRYCAVLGHPIAHSASPAMQNAGLGMLGLNWRYLAADVPPAGLKAAIQGAQALGFIGLNLTVPHKLRALRIVDVVDPDARKWGAINTIVFETRDPAGRWVSVGSCPPAPGAAVRSHGYNTDADAIIQALQEGFGWRSLRGATVLLLGAGGAAQAAALRLAQEGIKELWLVNRTAARRRTLQRMVARQYPRCVFGMGYPDKTVDLVINATSLGLKRGDPVAIHLPWLKAHRPPRVFDMIYRPRETPLLRHAAKLGCQTVNGMGMLLYQGARALELWTGRPAPVAAMRRALEAHLYV
ncbi:MAG TPA: shikimate dehydrogenase [Verrucomicrobiae bacterium]|nr:shikimate dehydrogenase [Verrucomicrobiae bacterium]